MAVSRQRLNKSLGVDARTFVECARAHIEREVGRGAHDLAPLEELVGAKLVRLGGVPGQVHPSREKSATQSRDKGSSGGALLGSVLAGADAVLPVVGGAEVTAGVADHGAVQLLEGLDDILAVAVLVGERAAGVVEAAVDAAAHVSLRRVSAAGGTRGLQVKGARTL